MNETPAKETANDEIQTTASSPETAGAEDRTKNTAESPEKPQNKTGGGRPERRYDEREDLAPIKNIRTAERDDLGRRRRMPINEAVAFSELQDCTGECLSEEAMQALKVFVKDYDVRALENARDRAKELGYAPFTHLGIRAFHWIQHNCEKWVFECMEAGLENPEKIFPAWGCRFAATMSDVGQEECERAIEADCLYDMVTASPHWTKERRPPNDRSSRGKFQGRGKGGPRRNNHRKPKPKAAPAPDSAE